MEDIVGVSDGGLENGAANISWGIPVKYLNDLTISTEQVPTMVKSKIKTLFAAEFVDNTTEVIEGVNFSLKKIKTRSFAELDQTGKYSEMDALGLKQLLNAFGNFDIENFKFDIYIEEKSGATFVVPSGQELRIEGDFLVTGNNIIKQYIAVYQTFDHQAISLEFEGAVMPNYYTHWAPDLFWTYPIPYHGPNNSFIRRRAYFGNFNRNYLFEALASCNNYFIATAVLKDLMGMTNPRYHELWAKYAIATQLATFSI